MEDFAIELENVSVSFGDFLVLDQVFFTVRKGEFLAILGPNGSGKTTLLKCILGNTICYGCCSQGESRGDGLGWL